jgi:hypothetical protein
MPNEAKKIKKILRNKDNKVSVKVVETDCWGGDRVLTSTTTYGNLVRETLLWEQEFKQKYGTPPGLVMDAPYLLYLLTVESKEGEQLYERTFWKKEEVRDFLIGGFDGVLRNG